MNKFFTIQREGWIPLYLVSALESNIETAITGKAQNEVTALDSRQGMIYGQMCDGQKVFVYHSHES